MLIFKEKDKALKDAACVISCSDNTITIFNNDEEREFNCNDSNLEIIIEINCKETITKKLAEVSREFILTTGERNNLACKNIELRNKIKELNKIIADYENKLEDIKKLI